MACVMVVEGEQPVREVLVDGLIDAGFEIVDFATADAASRQLQGVSVGLIVTGINLPGHMDGIGLAKAARPCSPSIPVVFISGGRALDDAQVVDPPFARLAKPFSLDLLVANVRRLLPVDSEPARSV